MNRLGKRLSIFALAVASVCAFPVGAQSSGGPYRIERSVIAGGGASLGGGAFELRGTAGQSVASTLSASGYRFHGGFWSLDPGAAPDLIFANGFDP